MDVLRSDRFKRIGGIVILALVLGMFLAFFVAFAHGTTTTPSPRPNSLGLSQSYTNPYDYMFGTIEHVDAFTQATNVVFKPFGASLLNTQTILFCGDLTKDLEGGDSNTLYLFAYRHLPTRMYSRVACHDVYRVLELGSQK
jgi:hypothetical protein